MIVLLMAEAVMLSATVIVLIGLRPLWRGSAPDDVRLLARGLGWFVASGASTGAWGVTLAFTELTVPVEIAFGVPVGGLLASGGFVGAAYIVRFFYETIPADERHRWHYVTAAFYPHHPYQGLFAASLRRWWRGSSE